MKLSRGTDLLLGCFLLCPDVGIILCQCLGHGNPVIMQLQCFFGLQRQCRDQQTEPLLCMAKQLANQWRETCRRTGWKGDPALTHTVLSADPVHHNHDLHINEVQTIC